MVGVEEGTVTALKGVKFEGQVACDPFPVGSLVTQDHGGVL